MRNKSGRNEREHTSGKVLTLEILGERNPTIPLPYINYTKK